MQVQVLVLQTKDERHIMILHNENDWATNKNRSRQKHSFLNSKIRGKLINVLRLARSWRSRCRTWVTLFGRLRLSRLCTQHLLCMMTSKEGARLLAQHFSAGLYPNRVFSYIAVHT